MEQANSSLRTIKTPSMGVFFSPPEAHKPDSFSNSQSPLRQTSRPEVANESVNLLPSIRQILSPISPPVSPATKVDEELGTHAAPSSTAINDPELFPHESSTVQTDAAHPLFRSADHGVLSGSTVVDQHLEARLAEGSKKPRPSRKDYELAMVFKSRVVDRFNADAHRYMTRELEYLEVYPPRFPQKSIESAKGTKRKADAEDRPAKRARPAAKAKVEKLPNARRAPRSSPKDLTHDSFDPQPVHKHRRKASRATPIPRSDMDYRTVPDYAPPVSTMASGKNLKIDWKGHPLDLSDDPDRHMLDEQEVTLASVLRLTAAQYLFAKRKIFDKYVQLALVGKDFNKTSAQGVCHIDVNKASKLWLAFEKVGWFDRKHFLKYLS